MGAGLHGGFGNTHGAKDSHKKRIYTPVQYRGFVKVDGVVRDVSRRVSQRNDINIHYVDPKTGRTNLELMLSTYCRFGISEKNTYIVLQKLFKKGKEGYSTGWKEKVG